MHKELTAVDHKERSRTFPCCQRKREMVRYTRWQPKDFRATHCGAGEERTSMDTFIDKLSQKKNAQEMIRANSAAEAAKMAEMQNQLKTYDEVMQEIRRVNLKTSENVENVRKLLAECMEKLEGLETDGGDNGNVEQELAGIKALLQERFAQSEDFMHKESVKVYRNVQAAFTEELEKQTEQAKVSRGHGTPLWLSVLILVGVTVDIAVTLIPLVLKLTNIKLF